MDIIKINKEQVSIVSVDLSIDIMSGYIKSDSAIEKAFALMYTHGIYGTLCEDNDGNEHRYLNQNDIERILRRCFHPCYVAVKNLGCYQGSGDVYDWGLVLLFQLKGRIKELNKNFENLVNRESFMAIPFQLGKNSNEVIFFQVEEGYANSSNILKRFDNTYEIEIPEI